MGSIFCVAVTSYFLLIYSWISNLEILAAEGLACWSAGKNQRYKNEEVSVSEGTARHAANAVVLQEIIIIYLDV